MTKMLKNNIWTYEQISGPHVKLMKFIAVIPFEGRSLNYIGTKALSIYCHIVNILYNGMFTICGLQMIVHKNIEVDYICEQIVVENVCLHYLLMFLKREKLVKLMELCKDLWTHVTPVESKIIRIYERKAYYFRNCLITITYVTIAIYIVTAQIVKIPLENSNGTTTKGLPFRFFINIHDEPLFSILTVIQSYILYAVSTIFQSVNATGLYLVMMACGYLKSLQYQLNSLSEIKDAKEEKNCEKNQFNENELILKNARACAQFHQKIMIFCEELELFLRSLNFITVSTTVYNMSILGFKILEQNEETFKYVSLFFMNLFEFFVCQWSPEYLLEESSAIAEAAYFATMNQSNYQKEVTKILYFMIIRAQRPIQLTAAGYINLSMETFANMLKSAFSFFALLCTVDKN